MKVEKIKYSKHFHPIQPSEWVGVEVSIDDTEDALKAFARAKELVESAYASSNNPVEIQVNKMKESKLTGDLVKDIMSCEDLLVLSTYRLIIEGNESAKEAYELRRSQIMQNQ